MGERDTEKKFLDVLRRDKYMDWRAYSKHRRRSRDLETAAPKLGPGQLLHLGDCFLNLLAQELTEVGEPRGGEDEPFPIFCDATRCTNLRSRSDRRGARSISMVSRKMGGRSSLAIHDGLVSTAIKGSPDRVRT